MLDNILAKYQPDKDLPERSHTIDIRNKALYGTLYDVLNFAFEKEENGAKEYIPLTERRPSVRCDLVKTVVDDSVSLLFSEGHFPAIQSEDKKLKENLELITKKCKLNDVMIDAATRGSVGSVAILVRFLAKRVFLSVLQTTYLTPIWKKDEPDTLEMVAEKRKVTGAQLRDSGYSVDDKDLTVQFWFEREWNSAEDCWYVPRKVIVIGEEGKKRIRDNERSVEHDLGFVPLVWIKNLPGGDEIDGAPTFSKSALSTVVEIDYQMSQAGRGLRYSSDPTLLIKEPSFNDGDKLVRSASNAITVDADGDAKLLEIDGTASAAVIEYCRALREMALEAMHGNRSSADKLTAAQSGRALELMHQALIWLADRLKSSYGEGAITDIYKMICKGAKKFPLNFDGKSIDLPDNPDISLKWPKWFPPTANDNQTTAIALTTMVEGGVMSVETAVTSLASDFDVEDVPGEITKIDADRKQKLAELPQPQGKVSTTV